MNLIDTNGRAFFTYQANVRWMAYFMEYLALVFIISVTVLCVALKSTLGLDSGTIALVLTSAMDISGPF